MSSRSTLSSRIANSLSRSLVGSTATLPHHMAATASSVTSNLWMEPPSNNKSGKLTASSLTASSSTSTRMYTSTTPNNMEDSTPADANIASRRGQEAVHLLPTYLADARKVQQYCPDTAPDGALQLGVAESQLCPDLIMDALNDNLGMSLTEDCIYYQPTHGRLGCRQAMAQYITQLLNLKPGNALNVEGLVVGAGCNAVLENLCTALAEAGDAVLIPTPYYAAFEFDLVARANLVVQPVYTQSSYYMTDASSFDDESSTSQTSVGSSTTAEDDANPSKSYTMDPSVYYPTTSALDVAYEEAQSKGNPPKILLLSHPHNPLGICYPKHVLQECIDWCRSNKVHLISDEIYAGSVYQDHTGEAQKFHSILKVAAGTEKTGDDGLGLGPYIHWVYALSKDFALSGLRVGVAYSENPAIRLPMQKLNDLCQISSQTQLWVERTMMHKQQQGMPWPEFFRQENHKRLRARCRKLLQCLEECNIPYLYPTSGLFCWINLSKYLPPVDPGLTDSERERCLYLELVQEYGLLFTPGDSMKHEEPGYFRIVFTAACDEKFELGLKRLKTFVNSKQDK